jgi:uncharacterized damage-inducible protein DinB
MTLNEFIVDALDKENGFLMDALDGLGSAELGWQPVPDANSIGWILWHMVRVEDMWIQFFAQFQTELWETEGWHEKFGLPTRDNGFGHTSEQVAAFPTLDLAELIGYGDAVRAETLDYLRSVTPEEFERVPREQRPEMSVAAIFRQVIGEVYQHQGQIAYLKGLLRSGSGTG